MIFSILITATFLRIINLNQSLWLDEATQVILSSDSIKNILSTHGADFHPPLSYLILHYWMMFGVSEVWLRLLSVAFGVLTIWIIYKFSLLVFNKKIGLLSAFLLAIAPYHVYYSQEVRMYAEAAFFACLSMYFFYLTIQKNKFLNNFGYIISTSALIYTHYDGFFLIFAQMIYLWVYKRNQFSYLLKNIFFVFIFFLPWVPQFLLQLTGGLNIDQYLPGWRDILSTPFYKAVPLIFLKFSLGRISFENKQFYIVLAIFIFSIVGYLLYNGIKNVAYIDNRIVVFWFSIPIIFSILISFKIPLNQPFRILYVLPALCILLALGIANLKYFQKIFLWCLIIIFTMGLSLYYFNSKYWREDWRKAVEVVSRKNGEDNLVVFAWSEPFPPYKFYAKEKLAVGVINKFPAKLEDLEDTLSVVDDKKGLYFFEYLQDLSDPNRFIQLVIKNKGFKEKEVYDIRGVGFIRHFVK